MQVAAVPCLGGVMVLERYYLRSSRELTRVMGTSKVVLTDGSALFGSSLSSSPLSSAFITTMAGGRGFLSPPTTITVNHIENDNLH